MLCKESDRHQVLAYINPLIEASKVSEQNRSPFRDQFFSEKFAHECKKDVSGYGVFPMNSSPDSILMGC